VYLIGQYTTTEQQAKREKHIQRIIHSVEMLTEMLNDLLSVGKIEEGRVEVKNANFDFEACATSIIGEMSLQLKPEQTISYHHEGNAQIWADPSLMKHVLMNLLSNAIKFSPEGSEILVTSHDDKNQFTVEVQDHGIGISAEDQQHLTERFYRGTNAANYQGTGLGLHIVSKYAELLQGKLTYESKLEQGSTFTLTLSK
jgi:signal transduction histidine kinase